MQSKFLRTIFQLSSGLITLILSASILSSSVFAQSAQVPCTNEPDFSLPIVNQLFRPENIREEDCSFYAEDSEVQYKMIDEAAVLCVDNPTLVGNWVEEGDDIRRAGNGLWELKVDRIPDSQDPDILTNYDEGLVKYTLSTQSYTDPNYQRAWCMAQGISDLTDCARTLGTAVCDADGNCHQNPQLDHPDKRTTTKLEQLVRYQHAAHHALACAAPNRASDLQCGNITFTLGPAVAALALGNTPQQILDAYFNLTPQERAYIESFVSPKMVEKFYLYVQATPNTQLPAWLESFLGGILSDTTIIERVVPTGKNRYDETILNAKKNAPPGQIDELVNQIRSQHYLPVQHTRGGVPIPIAEQIEEKIRLKNLDCTGPMNASTQILGGVGYAGPDDPSVRLSFAFLSNLLNPRDMLGQTLEDRYKVYALVPLSQMVMAALDGNHGNSPLRSVHAANTNPEYWQQSINIPLPINDPSARTNDPGDNTAACHFAAGSPECICPIGFTPVGSDLCRRDNRGIIGFTRGGQSQGNPSLPGSPAFREKLNFTNRQSLPLNDPQYFEDDCSYYTNFCSKAPGACRILNTLASPFNRSFCPIQPETTAPPVCTTTALLNGADIDLFLNQGATYFLPWQYAGTREDRLAFDDYSFFQGEAMCQLLQEKATQYPGKIGVNIHTLANRDEAQIEEHLRYVQDWCGTSIVRFWGFDDPDRVTKVLRIGQGLGLKFIVALADFGIIPGSNSTGWFTSGYQDTYQPHALPVAGASNPAGLNDTVAVLELINEPHCYGQTSCIEPYAQWAGHMSSLLSSRGFIVGIGQKASEDTTRGDSPGVPAPDASSDFSRSNNFSSIGITSAHFYSDAEKAKALQALNQSQALGKPFYIGEAGSSTTTCTSPDSPGSVASSEICTVAARHNINCDYLRAIWQIETGSATNCGRLSSSGLMSITDATYNSMDHVDHATGEPLDRCAMPDAFVFSRASVSTLTPAASI